MRRCHFDVDETFSVALRPYDELVSGPCSFLYLLVLFYSSKPRPGETWTPNSTTLKESGKCRTVNEVLGNVWTFQEGFCPNSIYSSMTRRDIERAWTGSAWANVRNGSLEACLAALTKPQVLLKSAKALEKEMKQAEKSETWDGFA